MHTVSQTLQIESAPVALLCIPVEVHATLSGYRVLHYHLTVEMDSLAEVYV